MVTNFNKFIKKDASSYSDFLNDLQQNVKTYSKIVKVNSEDWKQPEDLSIYTSLQAFNIFNVTQVRIFLLSLFECKDNNLISHKNYKKIITFLEYFHFVFTAICSSRPSGLERRYSSYARILRSATSKKESEKCVGDLITDLKDSIPDYSTFESKFNEISFTTENDKDKKLIQYILKKLEKFYAGDELKPNSFTIEHILPESTKAPCVGMIGNLLPLGAKLNEDLADKPFATKITKYPQSQYVSVKTFVEQYKETTIWDEAKIKERTKQIASIFYNIIE